MTARPLVWLYDLRDVRLLPLHDLGDLTVEDRLGDLETVVFTIKADDPKAYALQPDRLLEYNGRRYRVEELIDARDSSGNPMTEAYCEARWMDLGKRARAGSFTILGRTALQGLTDILAGTGWTAVVDPAEVTLYSMEDLDASVLSLVRRWAAITGREIEWDTVNLTVTLVPQIGQARGVGFRYGNNLRQIERRYRPPVATRLYPFGANNLDITAVNPLGTTFIEDFSWYTAQGLTLLEARAQFRKDQTWYDARYLNAITLYDAAVRRLAALAQPTISYRLAVADFSTLTGTTADDVDLGDTVRVRDPDFSIDIETRVVRLVTKDLRPQDNEIELDFLQPGLADIRDESTSRSIDYGELTVLTDANIAALTVTGTAVTFASIQITSTGPATPVLGGTFKGTATGTGTVRFSVAVNGTDEVPVYDFAFVAGQVEFSWPTFAQNIDASSTATITWRARVISGAGTIALDIGSGRGWLLLRGAVGVGVNNSPNQAIDETLFLLDAFDLADTVLVEIISPVDLDETESLTETAPFAVDDDTTPVVVSIT